MRMRLLAVAAMLAATGCERFTDPATRLAYAIEDGAGLLTGRDGSIVVEHEMPSGHDGCHGPYRAQFDDAGAIIVWCLADDGTTVSSHSTTYHGRFTETPATIIVDHARGQPMLIELRRDRGRTIIAAVS